MGNLELNCGHLSSNVLEAGLTSHTLWRKNFLFVSTTACCYGASVRPCNTSFYASSFTKAFVTEEHIPDLAKLALEEISPVRN